MGRSHSESGAACCSRRREAIKQDAFQTESNRHCLSNTIIAENIARKTLPDEIERRKLMKIAKRILLGFGVIAVLCALSVSSPAQTAQPTIETLASYPAGWGMEALTEAPDGTIYYELANDDVQSLWKITPDGKTEKWVDIPVKRPQVVLSIKEGFLISGAMQRIAGGAPAKPAADAPPPPSPTGDPTTTAAPPSTTDYDSRVVVLDKTGNVMKIIHAAAGCFLNGMTETHGEYLVVDARGGTIYRVDIPKGELELWLHDDLLAPTVARNYPGANGMRAFGDWLYWTNTVRSTMYRIHIGKDGRPDGTPEKFASFPGGDDFGVAKDGTMYASSGMNMLKISPTGQVSTLLTGVANSPAAIVTKDQHWLYWTARGTNSTDPAPVPRLFRVRLDQ